MDGRMDGQTDGQTHLLLFVDAQHEDTQSFDVIRS